MDEITKYIETSLKYRLGLLTEAPEEDGGGDAGAEGGDTGGGDEDGGDDLFSQDDVDAAAEGMGAEGGDAEGGDAEGGDEGGGGTSPEGQESSPPVQSDQAKIQELFTDSGDPKVDYSLTADSNIRLARFKFKYSGIDPMSLMSDDEKKVGVRADELESRLTPDQYQLYIQKNKELRQEFPQIAERERKVIIYNSNVPMFYNDDNGVPRIISHKKDVGSAIDKLEKFMNKSFGEDWVDNKKAIKFLLGIKINFSEEKKIRPNLIPISYFQPKGERGIIAFNKLYTDIPPSIDKFIKDNIESEDYKKSPLFRTFINDYTGEQGEGSSRMSVYSVIMDVSDSSGDQEDSSEETDTDSSADSSSSGDETSDSGEESDSEGIGL